MANAGNENVLGLQVEMDYLMLMQIADNIKQLGDKSVSMLAGLEILWVTGSELCQSLTIDIFRQQIVITLGDIAHQMRMVETVARLKLLLQG